MTDHHRREEDEHQHCEQRRKRPSAPAVAVTCADHVDDGQRPRGARDDGHLLAGHAENQKARDDLRRGEDHPAEAELPGKAGPRNEGGDGSVGRNERHGEHEALEAAVAEEVFACKAVAATRALGPERKPHEHDEKERDRKENQEGVRHD